MVSCGLELVWPVARPQHGVAIPPIGVTLLQPLNRMWLLIENSMPGSGGAGCAKETWGWLRCTARSCRTQWRLRRLEESEGQIQICLAVSELGPACQTQVGNADCRAVLVAMKKKLGSRELKSLMLN